jgi:uncharacterized protein Yka (UPF0111/DUF47 family)
MRRWFLPSTPDVLGLLHRQGEISIEAAEAFAAWSGGDASAESSVRAKEHEADAARRELLAALRQAFVTPASPEDLYELSERLDVVVNGAKDLVREAELLDMSPDASMAEMAGHVLDGVRALVGAMGVLTSDRERATGLADEAGHHERELERSYRRGMSALLTVPELREVMGRRELYRRYARLGDAIDRVAHRVWYTVVKEA